MKFAIRIFVCILVFLFFEIHFCVYGQNCMNSFKQSLMYRISKIKKNESDRLENTLTQVFGNDNHDNYNVYPIYSIFIHEQYHNKISSHDSLFCYLNPQSLITSSLFVRDKTKNNYDYDFMMIERPYLNCESYYYNYDRVRLCGISLLIDSVHPKYIVVYNEDLDKGLYYTDDWYSFELTGKEDDLVFTSSNLEDYLKSTFDTYKTNVSSLNFELGFTEPSANFFIPSCGSTIPPGLKYTLSSKKLKSLERKYLRQFKKGKIM